MDESGAEHITGSLICSSPNRVSSTYESPTEESGGNTNAVALSQDAHFQTMGDDDAIKHDILKQSMPGASVHEGSSSSRIAVNPSKSSTFDSSTVTGVAVCGSAKEGTEHIDSSSKELVSKSSVVDEAYVKMSDDSALASTTEEEPVVDKSSTKEECVSEVCMSILTQSEHGGTVKDSEHNGDFLNVEVKTEIKSEETLQANTAHGQETNHDSCTCDTSAVASGCGTSLITSLPPSATAPVVTDGDPAMSATANAAEAAIDCITLDSPISVIDISEEVTELCKPKADDKSMHDENDNAGRTVDETCAPGTSCTLTSSKKPRKSPAKKKGSGSVCQKTSKKSGSYDSDDYTPDGFGQKQNKRFRRRKTKVRDANAPTPPLSGYLRFLNSRRESLRTENPSMAFSDIIKRLAQQWSRLSPEEKKPWQQEADEDRQRYLKEMAEYRKTDTYKDFVRQQQRQKQKELQEERKAAAAAAKQKQREQKDSKKQKKYSGPTIDGLDIPVFTEEFLDHNKACEAELRQLRRLSTDYEQQNASLSHIVSSMRCAVTSLEEETAFKKANNERLQNHLSKVRAALAAAFKEIPLPGTDDCPTEDTIDDYMQKMHNHFAGPETEESKALHEKISGIIERLDIG